jgi:hypothetical protein
MASEPMPSHKSVTSCTVHPEALRRVGKKVIYGVDIVNFRVLRFLEKLGLKAENLG